MLPPALLLSKESSHEIRAILTFCMTRDIPSRRVEISELAAAAAQLIAGEAMPVGNVPFLQEAFRLSGIPMPEPLTYHHSILPYLGRPLHSWKAGELRRISVPRPIFIKPAQTKLFTGFVMSPAMPLEQYSVADRESFQTYQKIADDEDLWTSPVVKFASEWRYYIQNGEIMGTSRYDPDGHDDAPAPDPKVVNQAAKAAWEALKHPFALDVGVLEPSGKTVVVELNDAWAVGLYGTGAPAPSPENYLSFLYDRWQSLLRTRTDATANDANHR